MKTLSLTVELETVQSSCFIKSFAMNLLITSLLAYLLTSVHGAKILGLFHRPSKGHHILASTLFKALAKRGHQVTVVSPHSLNYPVDNYEELMLTGIANYNEEHRIMNSYIQMQNASMLDKVFYVGKTVDNVNEKLLNHPVVASLLSSDRTFDLVIMLWTNNEAFLGIPYHFKAPVIAFATIGTSFLVNMPSKNPAPYSYVSGFFPLFPDEMNFLQRCVNTMSSILLDIFYLKIGVVRQKQFLNKYFPTAPPLEELVANVSLYLINTHFSIESPRPYIPSLVQIGGLHVQEPQEPQGDLKQFLDSAQDGALLFSLGSVFKSTDLPNDKLEAILDAFSRLPLKVLWKFERDNIPNLPTNVKVGKWLPQNDVLAHPNIKIFITHGGLLSVIEAIYHGVPLVGIPLFGDQDANIDDGVHKGYAVKLRFQDLTSETLFSAVNLALNDKSYAENIARRSHILRDQPLKPLDTAMYWVEYVLRHKGAHHLKTSALKLDWYQYYLLDVVAACIGALILIFGVSYLTVRVITRLLINIFFKMVDNTSLTKKIS